MLAKRAVVACRVRGMRSKLAAEPAASPVPVTPTTPTAPTAPKPSTTSSRISGFGDRLQGYGNQFWNWANEPGKSIPRWAMVGAGAGGLLGVLSSLNRRKEERQMIPSALTGLLAGGALGLGGGLTAKYLPKYIEQADSKTLEQKGINKLIEDTRQLISGEPLAESDEIPYNDPRLTPAEQAASRKRQQGTYEHGAYTDPESLNRFNPWSENTVRPGNRAYKPEHYEPLTQGALTGVGGGVAAGTATFAENQLDALKRGLDAVPAKDEQALVALAKEKGLDPAAALTALRGGHNRLTVPEPVIRELDSLVQSILVGNPKDIQKVSKVFAKHKIPVDAEHFVRQMQDIATPAKNQAFRKPNAADIRELLGNSGPKMHPIRAAFEGTPLLGRFSGRANAPSKAVPGLTRGGVRTIARHGQRWPRVGKSLGAGIPLAALAWWLASNRKALGDKRWAAAMEEVIKSRESAGKGSP